MPASRWHVEVDVSQLDTDLLSRLLAEVDSGLGVRDARAPDRGRADRAVLVPGVTGAAPADSRTIGIPTQLPCSLEYWIAAAVARLLRSVAAPEGCQSPGLGTLLAAGQYRHPRRAPPDVLAQVGMLMFKPGVRVTTALLDAVAGRAGECGYIVAEARALAPEIVRARQLIRRHYRIHQDIAERGALTARERLRLLDIYDRPAFTQRFGVSADRVPVMPVARFLEHSGVPAATLNRWSEAMAEIHGLNAGGLLGANEVGDDKYVHLFVDSRAEREAPTFLLNAHMPSVTGWYEQAAHPVYVCILEAQAPDALTWARMRRDFCGTTDPATACPGSLRRDSLEGLLPVNWESTSGLARANNGIHLSNGPVEALREIAIWFDRKPEDMALGRALATGAARSSNLLERSYMSLAGCVVLVTEATSGRSVSEAVDVLRRGHLLGIESQGVTPATLARVDLARRYARALAARASVTAVIATGSVARNRASEDSDLDLVIVTESTRDAVRIERAVVEGVTVECEWMTRATAMAVAAEAAGDLKSLRESSRIGFGVPVHDPQDIHREIEAAARHATPDRTATLARLRDTAAAVDAIRGGRTTRGEAGWSDVRGVLDNLAVVLLAFHPLRYQKPKWVIQDLEDAGHSGLADALMHAYAIARDRPRAAEAVGLVTQLVSDLGARLGLPSYASMLRHGFLDELPEYSFICRCLADAASLVADGRLAAAEYAAKFTAGMALALSDEATVRDELGRAASYRALFDAQAGAPVDEWCVEACVTWTERALTECRDVFALGVHETPERGT